MKKLSELKISPTPWNIKYDKIPAEYGGGRIVGGIVSRNGGVRIDRDIILADARFIVAAPKLYDVCFRVMQWEDHARAYNESIEPEPWNDIIKDMRAALAEAAGESEVK